MRYPVFKILLVEDDQVDVMNVKRALKRNNIANELYVAANGLEALAMLRGESEAVRISPPALILLDLNMPKMNGIEFLQQLRADPDLRNSIVVVLTTSDEERDITEAYNLNVAGYILKPIEPEEFIQSMSLINQYWLMCQMPKE